MSCNPQCSFPERCNYNRGHNIGNSSTFNNMTTPSLNEIMSDQASLHWLKDPYVDFPPNHMLDVTLHNWADTHLS